MSDTYRAVIPYESLDPLTIGSADDPAMVYRETLTLDIPEANLLAALYPDEPAPVANPTEACAAALEAPHSGPRFSEMIGPDKSLAIIIDNQFRPTPTSKLLPAVLDAIEAHGVKDARVVCANGKVFPMSERDTELKLGRENLARMERLGIPFFQNEPRDPEQYVFIGMTTGGTPVWLHKEVAKSDVTLSMGQAQSNHWGAGGGGKLILPGVVSDETIESNHCAFVMSPKTHYGALAGPMRTDIDEAATMCGLSATLNSVLDTQGAGSASSTSARTRTHTARRSASSTASTPTTRPAGGAGRHRHLRRLRADRSPVLPHRLGLHVLRPAGEGRRHADLLQPVPRREHASRRLPRPRAHGPDEALHAALAGEPGARLPRHPQPHHRDVGGLHLGADLRGHGAQAPPRGDAGGEPGDGGRYRDRGRHVAGGCLRRRDGPPRAGGQGGGAALRALPATTRCDPHAG